MLHVAKEPKTIHGAKVPRCISKFSVMGAGVSIHTIQFPDLFPDSPLFFSGGCGSGRCFIFGTRSGTFSSRKKKKKNGFPRPAPLRQKWSECTKQHTCIHFDFDPVSADFKRHRTTLPAHTTLQLTLGAQDYRGTLLRGHVLGEANNLPGTQQSSARAAANCKMGCSIFWRQFFALVRKNALTKRRSKLQLVRWGCGSAVLRECVDHHRCVAIS